MLYYALVFLVVGVIAGALNLAGVSAVAAAECRLTDLIDGGTIQGMPTWKGTTSSTLPPSITGERDFYEGLIPSPVLEVAPDIESSRIVRGKTEHQGMATIGACLSQDLRKSALFNHAMFRFNVKSPAKAHTQFMKVPVLLYNEKRQGLTIRTTPPEIGISARVKADTLIGPVQEIRKSVLSDNRTVSQTVATLPSTVESLSLFEGPPSVASNPFQRALQRPDNESLPMNLATGQVLQGGNCASRCP
jgi:hypothetical protein